MKRYLKIIGLTFGSFVLTLWLVAFGVIHWVRGRALQDETRSYARSAGALEAKLLFCQGRMWKYEIAGGRSETTFLRSDGEFDVFAVDYFPELGSAHRSLKKVYVEAFNEMMDIMVKNPEKFGFNILGRQQDAVVEPEPAGADSGS